MFKTQGLDFSLSISEVARLPEIGLCCVQSNPLQLPSLNIPEIMQEMNYGCGSTPIMSDSTLKDRLFAKFRYTYSRKNGCQQFTR